MWLIAGLGNPGRRYSRTRHNIGFRVLDLFASRQKCPWEERKRPAIIGWHDLGHTRLLLVKPQTYMNRSGEVIGRLVDEADVPIDSVIVVHDDMDLPFETLKLKKGGGAGGHRGIESILWELDSDRFLRVKMGIGRPEADERPEDYVLGAFPDEQEDRLPAFLAQGAGALECILERGIDRAMNLYNTRIQGEGEEAERGVTVKEKE